MREQIPDIDSLPSIGESSGSASALRSCNAVVSRKPGSKPYNDTPDDGYTAPIFHLNQVHFLLHVELCVPGRLRLSLALADRSKSKENSK